MEHATMDGEELEESRQHITNDEIHAAHKDEGLFGAVMSMEAVIQEQRGDGGGSAKQLAYRHTAITVEVRQQSAKRRQPCAEKGHTPVAALQDSHSAVGRAE